jgi:cell division protein ZapA
MAQVTLRINGYSYMVGCQDGEEQHLTAMANEVEQRINAVKAGAGQSGEARMLVMAALMMADDLFELHKRLADSEAGRLADSEAGRPAEPVRPDPKLSRKLTRMAKRAEDIAADLEHP